MQAPLPTLLSQALVAFTIEFDNRVRAPDGSPDDNLKIEAQPARCSLADFAG
jgi:hypothetical protein